MQDIRKLHYNEDGSIAEVGKRYFDPKKYTHVLPCFDPMKKESSNLLAQFPHSTDSNNGCVFIQSRNATKAANNERFI